MPLRQCLRACAGVCAIGIPWLDWFVLGWIGLCACLWPRLGAQPRLTGVLWRTSFLETADDSNLEFRNMAPLCDEMRIFWETDFLAGAE